MSTIGYVRVSTVEQCVDRQILALTKVGVPRENIYVDYLSGKDFIRPAYQKMKKQLKKGDLLVVLSLDRLGRNYHEILTEWRYLVEEIGIDISILDMQALDTRRSDGLIDHLITDIVLQLLSYVAQTEREFILERQSTGIEAAKLRGVKFGRPKLEVPDEFPHIISRWSNREISAREAARRLGISHTTFLRWAQDFHA